MKIQDIFTADELALIDSGDYKPGRAVLDAKLDLAMALEREECAKAAEEHMREREGISFGVGAAIRARGNACMRWRSRSRDAEKQNRVD